MHSCVCNGWLRNTLGHINFPAVPIIHHVGPRVLGAHRTNFVGCERWHGYMHSWGPATWLCLGKCKGSWSMRIVVNPNLVIVVHRAGYPFFTTLPTPSKIRTTTLCRVLPAHCGKRFFRSSNDNRSCCVRSVHLPGWCTRVAVRECQTWRRRAPKLHVLWKCKTHCDTNSTAWRREKDQGRCMRLNSSHAPGEKCLTMLLGYSGYVFSRKWLVLLHRVDHFVDWCRSEDRYPVFMIVLKRAVAKNCDWICSFWVLLNFLGFFSLIQTPRPIVPYSAWPPVQTADGVHRNFGGTGLFWWDGIGRFAHHTVVLLPLCHGHSRQDRSHGPFFSWSSFLLRDRFCDWSRKKVSICRRIASTLLAKK